MTKHNEIKAHIVSAVLVFTGIIVAFIYYLQSSEARILSKNKAYSYELTKSKANFVSEIVNENISCIKMISYLYGTSLKDSNIDFELLKNLEANMSFDWIRFIDKSGLNYSSNGQTALCMDRDYYQNGINGQTGVTHVGLSRINGKTLLGVYAPVYYQDEIIGVMVGFIDQKNIDHFLESELFGYKCNTWLCTSNGLILSDSSDIHITNALELINNEKLLSQVSNEDKSIDFKYKDEHGYVLGHAFPINNTNWFICQTLPSEVSRMMISKAKKDGYKLLGMLIFLYLAYLCCVSIVNHRKHVVLLNQAERDGLTKLYNVFAIEEKLDFTIHNTKYYSKIMVGFVDIDNFKDFNSNHGHDIGDLVIKYVAKNLSAQFGDSVGRNGGDEFLIWSDTTTTHEEIAQKLEEFMKIINAGLTIPDTEAPIPITCSIGIAVADKTKITRKQIVVLADKAMYDVKNQGKNKYVIYEK